jgi:hypothetical protein
VWALFRLVFFPFPVLLPFSRFPFIVQLAASPVNLVFAAETAAKKKLNKIKKM